MSSRYDNLIAKAMDPATGDTEALACLRAAIKHKDTAKKTSSSSGNTVSFTFSGRRYHCSREILRVLDEMHNDGKRLALSLDVERRLHKKTKLLLEKTQLKVPTTPFWVWFLIGVGLAVLSIPLFL